MIHNKNPIIKHKIGLLHLTEELGYISKICEITGISRDTFHRYYELINHSNIVALVNTDWVTPNKERQLDPNTEVTVVEYAFEQPAHGQARASSELSKRGIAISSVDIRSIWLRNNLENVEKRLKALEIRLFREGITLSGDQVAARENKPHHDQEFCHKKDTTYPGFLGSQDTFYAGNLKGIGRIYQQTYVDSYSEVAFCNLYTCKTAITAADMLNDKVLPFFKQYEIPILRILTDRGNEYCGQIPQHDYQLYLAINNIEHISTKVKSPQINSICQRFNKTILNEFYHDTFRRKPYKTLSALQADLDNWMNYYNNERNHQGSMCRGRTPMNTLREGKSIWLEKYFSQFQPDRQ